MRIGIYPGVDIVNLFDVCRGNDFRGNSYSIYFSGIKAVIKWGVSTSRYSLAVKKSRIARIIRARFHKASRLSATLPSRSMGVLILDPCQVLAASGIDSDLLAFFNKRRNLNLITCLQGHRLGLP